MNLRLERWLGPVVQRTTILRRRRNDLTAGNSAIAAVLVTSSHFPGPAGPPQCRRHSIPAAPDSRTGQSTVTIEQSASPLEPCRCASRDQRDLPRSDDIGAGGTGGPDDQRGCDPSVHWFGLATQGRVLAPETTTTRPKASVRCRGVPLVCWLAGVSGGAHSA